jgi:hypothetical protein
MEAVTIGARLLPRLLHRLHVRFARRCQRRTIGFEAFARTLGLNEAFAGGLQTAGFVRHLLFGLDGFAAQAFATRIRLFQPHAVHTVIGAQLAKRLRQPVNRAVQLLAAMIEPIDTCPPLGNATLQFRQIQFRLLYPFAQHVELLAAFDDAVADVFAAVDAQPVRAEPDTVARDHAFAVTELRTMVHCHRQGLRRVHAVQQ